MANAILLASIKHNIAEIKTTLDLALHSAEEVTQAEEEALSHMNDSLKYILLAANALQHAAGRLNRAKTG